VKRRPQENRFQAFLYSHPARFRKANNLGSAADNGGSHKPKAWRFHQSSIMIGTESQRAFDGAALPDRM
jgi:hypothetical protein